MVLKQEFSLSKQSELHLRQELVEHGKMKQRVRDVSGQNDGRRYGRSGREMRGMTYHGGNKDEAVLAKERAMKRARE